MIISPSAKEVTNVVKKIGSGFVKINEVLLFRRMGLGSPYRKVSYWRRGVNSTDPPSAKFTSFAIVPVMTNAKYTEGFEIIGNGTNTFQAFNRDAQNAGTLGTETIVSFPTARQISGWALQFAATVSAFNLEIEGIFAGAWTTIVPYTPTTAQYNYGHYAAVSPPRECTAVKIRTNLPTTLVRTCQFFEAQPLLPITMTSNGSVLSSDPVNNNLYLCFRNQSSAYSHGTVNWYYNGGEWRNNRGMPSTKDLNQFLITFAQPKAVSGFSIGGLANYTGNYCYANCLLIEGRESGNDFWRRIAEVEFEPAERKTRYFDFPVSYMVGQLRVSVQDITQMAGVSANTSLYLSPMQVWGETA